MSHPKEILFDKLEANDKKVVEEFKQCIREQSKSNDPWLINGLYDYYLNTNSIRCMEVLIALKEPHQQYLFDRLLDSLKNPKTELKIKVQALTLLGHIARSQPTWLQKLPDHPLFQELLKFLKTEAELLPLISALLVLIIFLPMFPSSIGNNYLDEIFEIFRRLAAWNVHVPGKLVEDQMIHLQVALYALFLRLYGMFPCNFLFYLQSHFKDRNNPVFCHTIKPMMDTIKIHPSLITTSKENETTTERWKKMGVHDVIVECERFSLDITDRCPHETCQNTTEFRSRSGTMNSTIGTNGNDSSYQQQNLKTLITVQMSSNDGVYSPSKSYHVQTPPITETVGTTIHHIQGVVSRNKYSTNQEGSPPEAAIEATPETTPIRDFNTASIVSMSSKSNVARAITSFRSNAAGYIVSGTPTSSVPSSPMRKEPSPFIFPSSSVILGSSAVNEPTGTGYSTIGEYCRTSGSVSAFARASGVTLSQHIANKLSQDRVQIQGSDSSSNSTSKPPPSSPLKIQNSEASFRQRIESPLSQEDEEVSSISVSANKSDGTMKIPARACDSVLPDINDRGNEMEHGSPCSAGGLHMPNSKSINNFKKRIRRFRYHSHTEPEHSELSTDSSPGNGIPYINNSTVRRANSCPDMKKSPIPPAKENQVSNTSNGIEDKTRKQNFPLIHAHTQTEVFWPMPYEHLFLMIFPSLREETNEVKPSPAPSPAPVLHQAVEQYKPSLYDILDKYIESCVATADNSAAKDQLQLVHQQLLFERHRRETHAYGNRRLLSDAKSTRLLEEYNSALRDQVQLEQKEIDDLRKQLQDCRIDATEKANQLSYTLASLQDECKNVRDQNNMLKEKIKFLESDVSERKNEFTNLDKRRQKAEAALFDAYAEVNMAKEQALAGEKVKQELQRVNRELLLKGELHIKYREKLEKLDGLRQREEEIKQLNIAYEEEIKALHCLIESKSVSLEAYKTRALELEQQVAAKEEVISEQKQTLACANEERQALLKAVENKYETQLAINRTLEQKILELRNKLEIEAANKKMNSPDTSSCHEVQVTTTAGLSTHSSPLSASLASSVGSNVQDKEVRNLQVYAEEKDS